jgi:threonine aldolase
MERRTFLRDAALSAGVLTIPGLELAGEAAAYAVAADDRDVFERCDRWLGEHGPVRPHDLLRQLAEATPPELARDLYGRGDLIESFEREVATLLGKEAAIFLVSGTMGQQIAFRIHCERNGRPTIGAHALSHPVIYELGAGEILHGLRIRVLGTADRLLTHADLQGFERASDRLGVFMLELPQRELGGQLPSWEQLTAQVGWARDHGAAVHMDGARLWESAPFYERSYAEIAALFDTVYVSLYKGIGGLAGCCVAGPADVIAEMRSWRLRMGGRIVHQFPYVLSARLGLQQRLSRFPAYHARAKALARTIAAIDGLRVLPDPPHAHMMHVFLRGSYDALLEVSRSVAEADGVLLFTGLRSTPLPDLWKFEIQVGDGIEAIAEADITRYFERLAAAGRRA